MSRERELEEMDAENEFEENLGNRFHYIFDEIKEVYSAEEQTAIQNSLRSMFSIKHS